MTRDSSLPISSSFGVPSMLTVENRSCYTQMILHTLRVISLGDMSLLFRIHLLLLKTRVRIQRNLEEL